MDGDQSQHTLPLPVARGFVTEHEGERIVPVGKRTAAATRIHIARVGAVHIDAAAVHRVVGQHDVLQRSLRVTISGRGQQRRLTVPIGLVAANHALRTDRHAEPA